MRSRARRASNDLQRAGLDRRERLAREPAAARDRAPRGARPLLPGGPARRVRADVLDEQQLAAGPEHAGDLAQGPLGVRCGAEHEVAHDAVHARVLGRQLLGGGPGHVRPVARPRHATLQAPQHPGVGLGEDELGHGRGVEGQRVPGAGADLERAALRPADDRAPRRPDAAGLDQLDDGRVDGREAAVPEAVGRQVRGGCRSGHVPSVRPRGGANLRRT